MAKRDIRMNLLVVLVIALIVSGCAEGMQDSFEAPLDQSIFEDPELSDNSGKLRILLTDAPIDNVEAVYLTVSSVTAIREDGRWLSLSNETRTIDLLQLRYGLTDTLGVSALPSGSYDQIRMLVTEASIVVDSATYPLFVPSGTSSGVKISFRFTVTENQINTMLIDWDAASSVHYAPGEGYIMRPNITVRSFRTEELDVIMPQVPTISSATHPDSNAWSLNNNAEFEFTASDDIGVDGFSYSLDQLPDTTPDEIPDGEGSGADACRPSEFTADPTIIELEPYVALEGSLVTIYGSNYGYWVSMVQVEVGENEAEVIRVSPTAIVFEVPAGLGSKSVKVITPKGEVVSDRNLEVISDTAFCPDGEFELGKGLVGKVYPTCDSHSWSCKLPDFSTLGEPQSTITACKLDIPTHRFEEGFPGLDENLLEWFAIRFTATLTAPVAGEYEFKVNSDDGSKLYVDGNLVVDNDGVHAPITRTGTIELTKGDHDFVVEYFQGPRWLIALQVWWTRPGGSEELIPKRYFNLPRNPAATASSASRCFCSGHGEGVYDYETYGISDGSGKLYKLNIYDEDPEVEELGVIKSPGNATLTDLGSLTIIDGELFGVNNSGGSQVKNRLYKILKDQAAQNKVPTEEIGRLTYNGSVVEDIDCLALSPSGALYGVSTDTSKLYSIDLTNADLTEEMDLAGTTIEGCAFGPSGLLYGTDNSGSNSVLVRIDIDGMSIDNIAELPFSTDIKSLGGHPDGFLYAGIDNQSNSYPAIAKIRPTDGVVVETLDPSVKISDVEGLAFDYSSEQSSCSCDMELDDSASFSAGGNIRITDSDGDGFSETVTFTGDQAITAADPESDTLAMYTGDNAYCSKPKSKIIMSDLTLDKDGQKANRFPFLSGTISQGFELQTLNNRCSYDTVLTADIKTDQEHIFATGNHGEFWIKLANPVVSNTINSNILEAVARQDEFGAIIFRIQIDNPSLQNNIKRGVIATGYYSFTLQPGEDVIEGDASDLPPCPDPSLHELTKSGSASYSSLSDGEYYFHVRTVDDSGNWSEAAHYRIRIDSTAPTAPVVVSATHPVSTISYANSAPEFSWSLSDTSGVAGYSYEINSYATTMPDKNIDSSSGSSGSTSYSDLVPGSYYFHIRAKDNAGSWGAAAHYKIKVGEAGRIMSPPPPGFHPVSATAFKMGSPLDHYDRFTDEAPHWVDLDPYMMMEKEVTNRQYKACVQAYEATTTQCETDSDCEDTYYCNSNNLCATGCENEPGDEASYHNLKLNHPVTDITQADAKKYCISQGYRLPSEAEWELAARGEDDDRYPWGDEFDSSKLNSSESMLGETVEVGSYEEGKVCNEDKCLYDMSGNVAEFTSDRYHTYQYAATVETALDNPRIDSYEKCIEACNRDGQCSQHCDEVVVRGGSFAADKRTSRVFYRETYPLEYHHYTIGFRCAMDWEETEGAVTPEETCDGVDNDDDGEVDEDFTDTDNDNIADCIDDDDDGDGVSDTDDNCPMVANADQYDPDLDGYGEVCDPDGEILPTNYAGMLRPYDVAVGVDGTIYVSG